MANLNHSFRPHLADGLGKGLGRINRACLRPTMRSGLRKMLPQGFTLIEVMSAMVIIAVAILALMRMFAVLTHTLSYREHAIIASSLAQRKMEEVRAIKKNNFEASVNDPGSTYAGYEDYMLYVSETPSWKGFSYLKKIDVQVKWPYPGGGTSSETISTLVASY